ncbi:MAG TPA: alpha/beta hydrolase [Dehalococcoidia bacterium]|jgi:pimeloyl-ACP methyl ester carboxylesterase|nr:alpha/beta hydrolase [Dehalococcoidia bacterium]
MPAVFVHGVPETHIIWDAIRARLTRKDVLAPDMPGFGGAPLPEGFTAHMNDYAAWLIAEIERAGEPIDLVGHDWGALLSLRAACLRPDLIRTWTIGSGAIDPDYVWHDTAKIWQTPGMGEQFMQAMTGDALSVALTSAGVPAADAKTMGAGIDDTMKDCILKLYRSAVNVGQEWGPDLPKAPKTGMLLWGVDDPYMQVKHAEYVAKVTGAKMVRLADTGHWWPLQRPDEAAKALQEHWASV